MFWALWSSCYSGERFRASWPSCFSLFFFTQNLKVLVLSYSTLRGQSLPRISVFRLTNCPNMTVAVYCGRKTTTQQILIGLLLKGKSDQGLHLLQVHLQLLDAFLHCKSKMFHFKDSYSDNLRCPIFLEFRDRMYRIYPAIRRVVFWSPRMTSNN